MCFLGTIHGFIFQFYEQEENYNHLANIIIKLISIGILAIYLIIRITSTVNVGGIKLIKLS